MKQMAVSEGKTVKNELFKDVQFYCIDKTSDKVKRLLLEGGAKEGHYLSQLVTVVISDDPNHSEVEEANDLLDIPVVTSRWVILSAKCGILLPKNGFRPQEDQLFTGVVACPSQLSEADNGIIWAMITFNGGRYQPFLDKTCTHLITTKPQGVFSLQLKYEKRAKYDTALEHKESVKIVTPDWIYDCNRAKKRLDVDIYHPKLLLQPKEPSPQPKMDVISTLAAPVKAMSFLEEINRRLDIPVETSVPIGAKLQARVNSVMPLSAVKSLSTSTIDNKIGSLSATLNATSLDKLTSHISVKHQDTQLQTPLMPPPTPRLKLPADVPPLQMKSSQWMTQQMQGAFGQPPTPGTPQPPLSPQLEPSKELGTRWTNNPLNEEQPQKVNVVQQQLQQSKVAQQLPDSIQQVTQQQPQHGNWQQQPQQHEVQQRPPQLPLNQMQLQQLTQQQRMQNLVLQHRQHLLNPQRVMGTSSWPRQMGVAPPQDGGNTQFIGQPQTQQVAVGPRQIMVARGTSPGTQQIQNWNVVRGQTPQQQQQQLQLKQQWQQQQLVLQQQQQLEQSANNPMQQQVILKSQQQVHSTAPQQQIGQPLPQQQQIGQPMPQQLPQQQIEQPMPQQLAQQLLQQQQQQQMGQLRPLQQQQQLGQQRPMQQQLGQLRVQRPQMTQQQMGQTLLQQQHQQLRKPLPKQQQLGQSMLQQHQLRQTSPQQQLGHSMPQQLRQPILQHVRQPSPQQQQQLLQSIPQQQLGQPTQQQLGQVLLQQQQRGQLTPQIRQPLPQQLGQQRPQQQLGQPQIQQQQLGPQLQQLGQPQLQQQQLGQPQLQQQGQPQIQQQQLGQSQLQQQGQPQIQQQQLGQPQIQQQQLGQPQIQQQQLGQPQIQQQQLGQPQIQQQQLGQPQIQQQQLGQPQIQQQQLGQQQLQQQQQLGQPQLQQQQHLGQTQIQQQQLGQPQLQQQQGQPQLQQQPVGQGRQLQQQQLGQPLSQQQQQLLHERQMQQLANVKLQVVQQQQSQDQASQQLRNEATCQLIQQQQQAQPQLRRDAMQPSTQQTIAWQQSGQQLKPVQWAQQQQPPVSVQQQREMMVQTQQPQQQQVRWQTPQTVVGRNPQHLLQQQGQSPVQIQGQQRQLVPQRMLVNPQGLQQPGGIPLRLPEGQQVQVRLVAPAVVQQQQQQQQVAASPQQPSNQTASGSVQNQPRDSLQQAVQMGQEQIRQQLQSLANQMQPQVVTPKTKTALANLLNNRLQGSQRMPDNTELVPPPIAVPRLPVPPPPPPSPATQQQLSGPSTVEQSAEYQRTLRNITNNNNNNNGQQPVMAPRVNAGKPQNFRLAMPPGNGHPTSVPRVQFYGHDPVTRIPPDLCLLGCVFHFVDYDKLVTIDKLETWKKIISHNGGEVEMDYSAKCTHIMCDNQRNSIVQQAMREGKRCVTAHWLNDILIQKKMSPPWLALHFPTPYSDDKPCKNEIITVSNFEGEERLWLKYMITSTGAKYTGYMSKCNTKVICKRSEGDKYETARDWKIPSVNVQWLQEILFGHYDSLRLPSAPKYQQFNVANPFKVDYALVPQLMAAWRFPVRVSEESWKKFIPNPDALTKLIQERSKRKLDNEPNNVHKRNRSSPELDENVTVTTRFPPDENDRPIVLFTGMKGTTEMAKKVQELGGLVAKTYKECTHLVADTLCRTVKYLCAISVCKFVVTKSWILESAKQNRFIDEVPYILTDVPNENHFDCNVKMALLQKRKGTLFKDFTFYVTPGVKPCLSVLKEIIECAGGTVVTKRPSTKEFIEKNQNSPRLILITCDNDVHLCTNFFKKNINVYNVEFILTGVMRQDVDYESFVIAQIQQLNQT